MSESKLEVIAVGANKAGTEVVGASETRRQIDYIKTLACGLVAGETPLTWDLFDDPAEGRSLFRAVEADRRTRVDGHTFMADRPPVAVVTAVNGRVIRLEYYEGHDALALEYDIRAPEVQDAEMPRWMERDPQAYDPWEFLKGLGFPLP